MSENNRTGNKAIRSQLSDPKNIRNNQSDENQRMNFNQMVSNTEIFSAFDSRAYFAQNYFIYFLFDTPYFLSYIFPIEESSPMISKRSFDFLENKSEPQIRPIKNDEQIFQTIQRKEQTKYINLFSNTQKQSEKQNQSDQYYDQSQFNNLLQRKAVQKQEFGRNITNNIYRVMLNHIFRLQKYLLMAEKIIIKYNLIFTIYQFKNLLQKKIKKLPSYIGKKEKKKVFMPITCPQFNLILTILSKNYLKYDHFCHAANSRKILNESKPIHLRQIRKLVRQLSAK